MFDEGRCFSCGLLAAVETGTATFGPSARYNEVSPQARYGGVGRPVCLIGARDVPAAIQGRGGDTRAVLEDDIHCPEWWQYIPGISPQEHRRESVMLGLEQRRIASEQRIADQNLQISQAIAASAQANAESTKAVAEISDKSYELAIATQRDSTRWQVLFAVFAIGSLVIAVLYPNGIDVPRTIEWLRSLWPL